MKHLLPLSYSHIFPPQTYSVQSLWCCHLWQSCAQSEQQCINNTKIFVDEDILGSDSVREQRGCSDLSVKRTTVGEDVLGWNRAGIGSHKLSVSEVIFPFYLVFPSISRSESKNIEKRKYDGLKRKPKSWTKQREGEGYKKNRTKFRTTLCHYLSRGGRQN